MFVLFLGILFSTSVNFSQSINDEEAYVCPPCDMECDKKHFNKPGNCDHCGMQLVKKVSIKPRKKVAILLFEGVQIIDFTGPYEIFGQARYEVYTVSKKGKMINTAMNMKVQPTYNFGNAPQPDILVIPGGNVGASSRDKATISWIKKIERGTEHLMSVCNGAFILAETNLLEGKTATTFYAQIPQLRKNYPKTKVVSDQRFVDNGKVITSAGLSAGIEAALHVVAKEKGLGAAQRIALHIEYLWEPNKKMARADYADLKYLRRFTRNFEGMKALKNLRSLLYEGNETSWNAQWEFSTTEKEKLWKQINQHLAKRAKLYNPKKLKPYQTSWNFKGEQNKEWKFYLALESTSKKDTHKLTMKLWQKGSLKKYKQDK